MSSSHDTAPRADLHFVKGDGILHDGYTVSAAFRGRLLGLELEFFTVDKKSLEPRNCLDVLARHSCFGTLVKPEAVCEQIEICTRPFWSLAELAAQAHELCAEAIELLSDAGALLLPVAYLDSPSFTGAADPQQPALKRYLGEPFTRHAGSVIADQINVGADGFREACAILEATRTLMPDIVALGGASPFRDGVANGVACNRLDIYEAALAEAPGLYAMPPQIHDLADYARFIQAQPRFQHPTTCYSLLRPMPDRGVAVELRCLDKQPRLVDTLAFAALMKAVVLSTDSEVSVLAPTGVSLQRARRDGVVDREATRRLVAEATTLLPPQERHYLLPLLECAEGETATARMTSLHAEVGFEGLWRSLADEFLVAADSCEPNAAVTAAARS
ncbi:MAG: glutamate-cysteine ligase family protein [Acidimicrobiales bacterium]